jgi:hypothetical protein
MALCPVVVDGGLALARAGLGQGRGGRGHGLNVPRLVRIALAISTLHPVAATLRHPWNAELCDREGILCAADWPELAALVAPLLERAA